MEAVKEIAATTDPYAELEAMLRSMSCGIVDLPSEVVIKAARGDGFVHFEVHCDDGDAGALIGTRGRYADAIRTLLQAAASVRKLRVTVHLMARDGGGASRR